MAIKKTFGKDFNYRENTMDLYVLKDVANPLTYMKKFRFNHKDRILDIGGNIGSFPFCFAGYVEQIVSYEPDIENYKLAVLNTREAKNAEVVHGAVVGGDEKELVLYLNGNTNMGNHTVIPVKGRAEERVPAYNINEVCKAFNPNKIKMDCEGSEYRIIMGMDSKILEKIDIFVFEWHKKLLKDHDNSMFREVITKIEGAGLVYSGNRDPKGWYFVGEAHR